LEQVKCKICGKEVKGQKGLLGHLKVHRKGRKFYRGSIRIPEEDIDDWRWFVNYFRGKSGSSCHMIITWVKAFRAYVESGVIPKESNPPTIAVYQTFLGKPRSRYKKKKEETTVYEYGSKDKCLECDRKADYVIISRPSEDEKILSYYCRYHFEDERQRRLRTFGRVAFREL